MEYRQSGQLIETAETGNVARCVEYGFKAVVHNIPWRCRRMNVISAESQQIDKEERQGEMQVVLVVSFYVEIEAEGQRHRHPAQIEKAGMMSAKAQ